MDEAKEKFFQCHDDTKSAFDELCAMVDALNVSTTWRTWFQSNVNLSILRRIGCVNPPPHGMRKAKTRKHATFLSQKCYEHYCTKFKLCKSLSSWKISTWVRWICFERKTMYLAMKDFSQFQSEREEKRGAAIARFEAMKAWNAHLREKNQGHNSI